MENRKPLIIAVVAIAIILATVWGLCLGGTAVYFLTRDDGARETRAGGPRIRVETEPRIERFLESETVVVEVMPGTPAEEAGLQPGQMILAVDGTEVDEGHDLAALIGRYEPGDKVTLTVAWPGREAEEVRVKLGRHPDDSQRAYLGITFSSQISIERSGERVVPPGEWIRPERPFILPDSGHLEGLFIIEVGEGTPAEEAGLQAGDLILAVDGDEIDEPGELKEVIASFEDGDRVTLTVYQNALGEERDILLKLAEHPDNPGQAYLGVTVGLVSINGPPGHRMMPGIEFFDGFPHRPGGERWDGGPFEPGEFEYEFEHEFDFEMPHSDGDHD